MPRPRRAGPAAARRPGSGLRLRAPAVPAPAPALRRGVEQGGACAALAAPRAAGPADPPQLPSAGAADRAGLRRGETRAGTRRDC